MRKLVLSAFAGLSLTAIPLVADAQTLPACGLRPACNTPGPAGSRAGWRNFATRVVAGLRLAPNHRARDLFMKTGGYGVMVAKFAYGPSDKDLEDEDVDVFIQNGCGAQWFNGGTVRTTKGNAKIPALPPGTGAIEGSGGRVYFDLSRLRLAVGKHRIRMVVKGDGSSTEAYVEVLPSQAQIVITDLDGTQTESEWAAIGQLFGMNVSAHAKGAEVMTALAMKGYYPLYLTARPEWFMKITRDWLNAKGYPPGLLRTTSTLTGVNGSKATAYKVTEIKAIKDGAGVVPFVGFGNKASDVEAYRNAGLTMTRTFYYQLTGNVAGGHKIDSYAQVLPIVAGYPAACR